MKTLPHTLQMDGTKKDRDPLNECVDWFEYSIRMWWIAHVAVGRIYIYYYIFNILWTECGNFGQSTNKIVVETNSILTPYVLANAHTGCTTLRHITPHTTNDNQSSFSSEKTFFCEMWCVVRMYTSYIGVGSMEFMQFVIRIPFSTLLKDNRNNDKTQWMHGRSNGWTHSWRWEYLHTAYHHHRHHSSDTMYI